MMRRTRRQAMKEAEEAAKIGNTSTQGLGEKSGIEDNSSTTPVVMSNTGTEGEKKTRPPRKKRKIKGNENAEKEMDEYERDVVGCNSDVFNFIITIFQEIQHLCKTTQRRKFLVKMNDFYLKKPSGNEDVMRHQKHFATCLWHIMLPVMQSEKNIYSDAVFRFFKAAVLGVGQQMSQEDGRMGPQEDGSETPFPLVKHIPHFILKFHCDRRPNVRVRILDLLKDILLHAENYPEQIKPVRDDLFTEVIQNRIRDKIAAVRTIAVQCLPYFRDNMAARQVIQFSSSYDPNPEVRRSALSFLPQFPSIKTSLYITRVFDTSEIVRTEAFLQISKLEFSRLVKKAERHKLLDWGLSPSSGKAREVVAKVLLPHWLSECNNNLVTLFSRLGLLAKPKIGRQIIDALYPEGSSKEYDEIDWTFIGEGQKLIPMAEITVEKAQVWLLLCEKFKNTPFCANRLLPEPIEIMEYLERFLVVLREQQKTGDEDFSRHICFFITLKLCHTLNFEESVRREMVEVLKNILIDPVIGDALIINTVIDLCGKLVEAEKLDDYLVVILKEFFDCYLDEDEISSPRKIVPVLEETEENASLKQVEEQVHCMTIVSPKSPNRLHSHQEASIHGSVEQDTPQPHPVDAEMTGLAPNSPFLTPRRKSPFRFQATSTPIRQPQVKVRDKLIELKSTVAETILGRHHLLSNLDKATSDANYLECHEIKQKVDACLQKERELQVQIEELKQRDESAYLDGSRSDGPGDLEEHSIIRGADDTFTSDSLVSRDPGAPMSTPSRADGGIIMVHSVLKALTILLRFLNWTRKISPYLRSLYEYQVIQCLEDEDARVRACTVYLYCLYGMLDRKIAKRALLISLQALQFDVYDAQIAGFKSVVDLLLSYPLEFFRPKAVELEQEDFMRLPHPFDNPNATNKELENGVIALLMKLGRESPDEMEIRILGSSKLLMKGRIQNINLLQEFLTIWINPEFGTTAVCYQIGLFIPMYSIIGVLNAHVILDAFLVCVKEIVACQEMEDKEDNVNVGLAGADVMKLAEFVAMNTSPQALSRFDDGFVVHERHALEILNYIKDNNSMRENQYLARSIKYFTVTKAKTAHDVRKIITEILEADSGNISGTAQVKNYLRIVLKQLGKKFGIELDSMEEQEEEGEGDEEEMKALEFLYEVIPKGGTNPKSMEMEVAVKVHEENAEEEMDDLCEPEKEHSISIS